MKCVINFDKCHDDTGLTQEVCVHARACLYSHLVLHPPTKASHAQLIIFHPIITHYS